MPPCLLLKSSVSGSRSKSLPRLPQRHINAREFPIRFDSCQLVFRFGRVDYFCKINVLDDFDKAVHKAKPGVRRETARRDARA